MSEPENHEHTEKDFDMLKTENLKLHKDLLETKKERDEVRLKLEKAILREFDFIEEIERLSSKDRALKLKQQNERLKVLLKKLKDELITERVKINVLTLAQRKKIF